jgi:hypothetical protein
VPASVLLLYALRDINSDFKNIYIYIGQAEFIELLLWHNADIISRSSTNWTPLHCASRSGHLEVIQLLLDNGADIKAQLGAKDTPLNLASGWGHLEYCLSMERTYTSTAGMKWSGCTPDSEGVRAFKNRTNAVGIWCKRRIGRGWRMHGTCEDFTSYPHQSALGIPF